MGGGEAFIMGLCEPVQRVLIAGDVWSAVCDESACEESEEYVALPSSSLSSSSSSDDDEILAQLSTLQTRQYCVVSAEEMRNEREAFLDVVSRLEDADQQSEGDGGDDENAAGSLRFGGAREENGVVWLIVVFVVGVVVML